MEKHILVTIRVSAAVVPLEKMPPILRFGLYVEPTLLDGDDTTSLGVIGVAINEALAKAGIDGDKGVIVQVENDSNLPLIGVPGKGARK